MSKTSEQDDAKAGRGLTHVPACVRASVLACVPACAMIVLERWRVEGQNVFGGWRVEDRVDDH